MLSKLLMLKCGRMSRRLIMIGGALTLLEGVLWYFLPIFFESQLNNMLLVGMVISGYSLGSLLVSLPAGDLTDRVGRKFTFMFGLVGFIASAFMLFFGGFIYSLIFMISFGVFATICSIPTDACMLDHSTKKNVPIVVALADMLRNFGWGFGPLIAAAMMMYFEVPLFISFIILALIAISVFSAIGFPGKLRLRLSDIRKSEKILLRDGLYVGECKRLVKLGKPLLAILIFSFSFGFWEYAVWTFEPIWTNSMGAGLMLGAVILMLDSIPYIPFSFAAGVLTNKLGLKKMFVIGSAFTIIGQSIFMIDQSLLGLTLTLIVTPVGVAFLTIPMEVYIRRHVKRDLYGEVYGIDSMFYEIGGVMGPLAVGLVAVFWNTASIIYVTFSLFVLSIAALTFMYRMKI